jgi:hypothetical protein
MNRPRRPMDCSSQLFQRGQKEQKVEQARKLSRGRCPETISVRFPKAIDLLLSECHALKQLWQEAAQLQPLGISLKA